MLTSPKEKILYERRAESHRDVGPFTLKDLSETRPHLSHPLLTRLTVGWWGDRRCNPSTPSSSLLILGIQNPEAINKTVLTVLRRIKTTQQTEVTYNYTTNGKTKEKPTPFSL